MKNKLLVFIVGILLVGTAIASWGAVQNLTLSKARVTALNNAGYKYLSYSEIERTGDFCMVSVYNAETYNLTMDGIYYDDTIYTEIARASFECDENVEDSDKLTYGKEALEKLADELIIKQEGVETIGDKIPVNIQSK